jgi:hypothetical protein
MDEWTHSEVLERKRYYQGPVGVTGYPPTIPDLPSFNNSVTSECRLACCGSYRPQFFFKAMFTCLRGSAHHLANARNSPCRIPIEVENRITPLRPAPVYPAMNRVIANDRTLQCAAFRK